MCSDLALCGAHREMTENLGGVIGTSTDCNALWNLA